MANNEPPQPVQDSSPSDRAMADPPRRRSGRSHTLVPQIGLIAFACLLWLINWLPIQAPTYVLLGNAVATQSRWNQLVSLSRNQAIDSEKIQWLDCAPASDSRLGSPTSELKVLKIRVGLQKAGDAAFVEREIERLTRPSSHLETNAPLRKSLREQRWRLEVVNHQIQRFQLDCEREGIAMSDVTGAGTFRLASSPKRIVSSNPSSQEHDTADTHAVSERRKVTDNDRSTWNRLTELKAIHEGNVNRLEGEWEHLLAASSGHFAITGAPRVSALPGKFSWARSIFAIALATSLAFGITFGSTKRLHWSVRWFSKFRANANHSRCRVQPAALVVSNLPRKSPIPLSEVSYDESEVARALERHSIAYWGVLSCEHREYESLKTDILRSRPATTPTSIFPPDAENGKESQEEGCDAEPRGHQWRLEPGVQINRFNRYSWFATNGPAIGDMLLVAWLCIFVLRYGVDSVWRELLFKAPLAAFSSVLFGI